MFEVQNFEIPWNLSENFSHFAQLKNSQIQRLISLLLGKLPAPQKVVAVPDIEWEKYSKIPSMTNKIQTRKNEKADQGKFGVTRSSRICMKSLVNPGKSMNLPSSNFVIRGRVFDDSKPKTFNQHWTPEEQRRSDYIIR